MPFWNFYGGEWTFFRKTRFNTLYLKRFAGELLMVSTCPKMAILPCYTTPWLNVRYLSLVYLRGQILVLAKAPNFSIFHASRTTSFNRSLHFSFLYVFCEYSNPNKFSSLLEFKSSQSWLQAKHSFSDKLPDFSREIILNIFWFYSP